MKQLTSNLIQMVLVYSFIDSSLLPVNVKGCNDFWEGHIGRDGSWYAHLVNL